MRDTVAVRLTCTWSGDGLGRLEYLNHNGFDVDPTIEVLGSSALVAEYEVPASVAHVVGSLFAFPGAVLRDLELRVSIGGDERVIARAEEARHYWRARGLWA